MAIYAVGDIQGCLEPLQRLLARARFDPSRDRLWLVGDLVNRGPRSLETLRFVQALGERAVSVLGNHDLALLAKACGARKLKRNDSLRGVLDAPDAAELIDWLRHRPVMHRDPETGWTLVHAGLAPQWDAATARDRAAELEATLRSERWTEFMHRIYGDEPRIWDDGLRGWKRLRFITNAFTRIRYCDADGALDLDYKGPPGTQPAGLTPWFDVPWRRNRDMRIVFGHWSTLGVMLRPGLLALDSGCVWGGYMTLARLDGKRTVQLWQAGCPTRPAAARSRIPKA
jgi:bis(5'-nucleosyl)-tetraphosphatase (symmetrical)